MVPPKKFATSNATMKELVAKDFGQTKNWRLEDVRRPSTQTRGTDQLKEGGLWLYMYGFCVCHNRISGGSNNDVVIRTTKDPPLPMLDAWLMGAPTWPALQHR